MKKGLTLEQLRAHEYLNHCPYYGGRADVQKGIVKNVKYWEPSVDLLARQEEREKAKK